VLQPVTLHDLQGQYERAVSHPTGETLHGVVCRLLWSALQAEAAALRQQTAK
jgi:hypothetical protein